MFKLPGRHIIIVENFILFIVVFDVFSDQTLIDDSRLDTLLVLLNLTLSPQAFLNLA